MKNPLFGNNGAAHVYAPQKVALAKEIEQFDLGLRNFSKQVKKYLNQDIVDLEGVGAAGAVCFLNAKMQCGNDFVISKPDLMTC